MAFKFTQCLIHHIQVNYQHFRIQVMLHLGSHQHLEGSLKQELIFPVAKNMKKGEVLNFY